MFVYMDDRLGFVDTINDTAWIMDDFGMLIHVSWGLFDGYFQEV